MSQRFYQKAGVQVAIITGFVAIVIAAINIWHQRSQLVEGNSRLRKENNAQLEKIRSLEADLTPFRTVCVEWYGASGSEKLQKLADQFSQLQSTNGHMTKEIINLRSELLQMSNAVVKAAAPKPLKQRLQIALNAIDPKILQALVQSKNNPLRVTAKISQPQLEGLQTLCAESGASEYIQLTVTQNFSLTTRGSFVGVELLLQPTLVKDSE